jgi:hypothetical protein
MSNKIPENIFLDTSVVNFILNYGEQIHDGVAIPDNSTTWERRDIEALRDIWLTGQRTNWHLTISPTTIAEIQNTRNVEQLQALLGWASELWIYSKEGASKLNRHRQKDRNVKMTTLLLLSDAGDRKLIQEAIENGCDAFCTRDWKIILRIRDSLRDIPLLFVSPNEWWQRIAPYATLFA